MRVTHRYKLMQVRGLTALLLRHAECELTWILFSTSRRSSASSSRALGTESWSTRME